MARPMHADDWLVPLELAHALIAAQMPDLAGLPLTVVPSGGTDNLLYRLGPDLTMRLPRTPGAAAVVAKEVRWLPVLAPHLPLPVSLPLRAGQPALGYPYPWSVTLWLPGQDAFAAPPSPGVGAALAGFIAALHAIPLPADAPRATGTLADRDPFTRQMIALVTDEADPARLTEVWQACLALPVWDGPPVWAHADLHPLNILTNNGQISAVIDWGGLAANDPAHDLIPAWTMLDGAERADFRASLAPDDATWARGRAYAFSKAVMATPYYRDTNPVFRDAMQAALNRTLADWPSYGPP